MSASDFRAAMKAVETHGISMYRLVQILECGSNQPRRWSEIGAPRYVALALAAVLTDLAPWEPERGKGRQLASKGQESFPTFNAEVERLTKLALKHADGSYAKARIDKHKTKASKARK